MGRAVKLPESDVTEYVPAKRTNRVALDVTEDAPAKRSKRVDPPAELQEEDPAAAAFLLANEITFHDADSPLPCMSFETAPFPKKLIKLLIAQPGFKAPSAVQAASWPLAVAGRDVLAIAKTGSGKTLGYLLPALTRCRLEKADANGSPICLIMAPTRELAIQICSEAVKFGEPLGCRAVAVYGGASKKTQSNNLQRGCEVIAATPGRMKDMLDIRGNGYNAVTSLTKCSILVLDEADRMLDMGFEKEIRSIVWEIPTPHQTLFYSATWPAEVECIAQDLLTNPAKVSVGSGGEKLTANKSVTQRVHVVNGSKPEALLKLLESFKPGKPDAGKRVIVFANTKVDVKWICNHCRDNGFSVDSISGDRSQGQRERVIGSFRDGSLTMVIATDVCGRGLDIEGIERVINYDFPGPDDYIHRIGRTGRAGATAIADSFFTDHDKLHAKELIRILTDAGQDVPAALASFTSKSTTFADSDDE